MVLNLPFDKRNAFRILSFVDVGNFFLKIRLDQ